MEILNNEPEQEQEETEILTLTDENGNDVDFEYLPGALAEAYAAFLSRLRQALRTQQGKRPCAALRPQSLQKARQTKDVVAMVVGQADGICPHQVHACPVCRCLRTLAAVPQQAVTAAGSKRRRECPVRQWHGSRSAQQCDGKHKDRSPCTMYLLRFYCTTAGPVAQSVPAAHRMAQHSKKGAAG